MAYLFTAGRFQAEDNSGVPLSGGLVYTYAAGTLTPLATYTTQGGGTPNANPVVLDSGGRASIWLGTSAYRIIVKTSAGVTLTDDDNITAVGADAANFTTNLAAYSGSSLVGFIQSGTGATATTLQTKLRESVSVKDFGAVGDGTTDDTVAVQNFLNYCYTVGSPGFLPKGTYIVSNVSVTVSGTRLTQGVRLFGAARNQTTIKQKSGATGNLFTFTNGGVANPASALQLSISSMTFYGLTKTMAVGLFFDGIANVQLEDLDVDAFVTGILWRNSLVSEVHNCTIGNCTVGQQTTHSGAGAYCNSFKFDRVVTAGCSSFAYDIGGCGQAVWDTCDTETCGTISPTAAVTFTNGSSTVGWTANGLSVNDPVSITTSGALPTGFAVEQIYYVASTATNSITLSATVGGAAITASSAGSGTHTAISAKTGAVVIRKDCIAEVGYGMISFRDCWFESNYGSCIRVEYSTGPLGLAFYLKGGHILGVSDGPSIAIGNARIVSIEDYWAAAGTDKTNISCDLLTLKNAYLINLVRPSVSYSTVINSTYNGASYASGDTGSFTGSLTGCTTVPTATVTYTVQGRDVTLNLPDLVGVSNTTAATVTGMPATLWPTTNRTFVGICRDSGTEKFSPVTVVSGTGVITLNNAFAAFTAAGNKGISALTVRYQI
jgi:hypothetical protein